MNVTKLAREPVVERLVCEGDAVLVIELAQQVSEGLNRPAGKRRDDREEQPAGRDRSKPLALPGGTTDLIDIVDGQRPCKRTGNSGKLCAASCWLRVLTPAMRLSLSLVYPRMTVIYCSFECRSLLVLILSI
jgi:hypothetical protein